MTEAECLAKMVAPGQPRDSKWRRGVIQVQVTRACNEACFGCTQNSQLAGRVEFMPVDMFEAALRSLDGYFGVVGVFGGNPAMHPEFEKLCEVMRKIVPFEQRGLWCNNPMTLAKAKAMRATFNPAYSNLNCHMSRAAYDLFKAGWPEAPVFGLDKDSRHSPTMVAMKDVVRVPCAACQGTGKAFRDGWGGAIDTPEEGPCIKCISSGTVPDSDKIHELISACDINRYWSAMVGQFRGQLRSWFCEVAGAQSILYQDDPEYPDTGVDPTQRYDKFGHVFSDLQGEPQHGLVLWWQLGMGSYAHQVRKHCFDCGVPLRRKGELAVSNADGVDEYSATHAGKFVPKRKGRRIELVTVDAGPHVGKTTDYMGNAR